MDEHEVIPRDLDCQYLRKMGDAPGWCKEADHPCPLEIDQGECLIEV